MNNAHWAPSRGTHQSTAKAFEWFWRLASDVSQRRTEVDADKPSATASGTLQSLREQACGDAQGEHLSIPITSEIPLKMSTDVETGQTKSPSSEMSSER